MRLKACPMCGPGKSIVECYLDDYGRWRVACGSCGLHSGVRPDNDREMTIEHWNNRPLQRGVSVYRKTMKDIREIAMDDRIVHDCLNAMGRDPNITEEDALIAMVCMLSESRAELLKEVSRLKVYEPISKGF